MLSIGTRRERKDHELVHRCMRRTRKVRCSYSFFLTAKVCKDAAVTRKEPVLKTKVKFKPVVQRADGSSKKTKKAKQVVAPIDRNRRV